jgi:hypothetical protein
MLHTSFLRLKPSVASSVLVRAVWGLSALLSLSAMAAQPAKPEVEQSDETLAVETSSETGRLSVQLAAMGAFSAVSVALPGEDAQDPVFSASTYLAVLNLPAASAAVTSFVRESPARVRSQYTLGPLEGALVQAVKAGKPGRMVLTQHYQLHNVSMQRQILRVTRYMDADVYGAAQNLGYMPINSKKLYIVQANQSPDGSRLFVGMHSMSLGQARHQVIAECCGHYAFDVPDEVRGSVAADEDGDGLSDRAGDMTMSERRFVILEPKQRVEFITRTVFGRASLAALAGTP